jgi:DNA adenine methylase
MELSFLIQLLASSQGIEFKRFQLDNFLLAEDWIVENTDFRELMKRYNKPRVLFYLDPPYLRSGKKYNYPFSFEDFEDLKKAIDVHHGTYLLNLSLYDKEMKEIFGEPNQVVDYVNSVKKGEKKQSWGCGYWWNFTI